MGGGKGRVGLSNTRRNLSFVRRLWRLSMDGKWWHGVMGHGTMGHSHNIDGKQILFPAGFERQFVAAAAADVSAQILLRLSEITSLITV